MNPHLDAVALLPEIAVVTTLALCLVIDLIVGETKKQWVFFTGVAGLISALIFSIALLNVDHFIEMSNGVYVVDGFSLVAKAILIASGVLILGMGMPGSWKGEYCLLLLASLLGMLMVSSARDFLLFFVTFELLAVPGYLLVAWNKRSDHGHEGALKYYLLGVVATAVMLYGISLIYGVVGSTQFSKTAEAFSDSNQHSSLVYIAVFFVIVGLVFKVAAVPFHFWASDAYQAAPVPIAAFLSVATKVAGFIALIEVTLIAFPYIDVVWAPLVWCLAALTMTVGNLLALRQTDLVRLLAYSSIAQAGYALVPLAVSGRYGGDPTDAVRATIEFLIIYAATNIGVFAIVCVLLSRNGITSVSSLRGLFRVSPGIAVLLVVFLLSLAGVPPFGGWFAKLLIFQSAVEASSVMSIVLAVIVAFNSAIGLVYYAGVLRQAWLPPDSSTSSVDVDAQSPHVASPHPRWNENGDHACLRTNPHAASQHPWSYENGDHACLRTRIVPNMILVLGATAVLVVISGVLPGVVTYVGELSTSAR